MKERKPKQLSNEELALFCEQFAMTLSAGLNHTDGITVMYEDAVSNEGRRILEKILDGLHLGMYLSEAMNATGLFPKYCIDMVRIGETSGKLEEVMNSLTFHYNREVNISEGIRNTLKNPFIIIFMMFIVILVLVIKVLPVFNQVFVQLGSEMTGFSRTLMNLGNILRTYSIVFIALLAVVMILYFLCMKTHTGRELFRRLLLNSFMKKSL